jgi:hypothetical protein
MVLLTNSVRLHLLYFHYFLKIHNFFGLMTANMLLNFLSNNCLMLMFLGDLTGPSFDISTDTLDTTIRVMLGQVKKIINPTQSTASTRT